jgi:hypothetical protein
MATINAPIDFSSGEVRLQKRFPVVSNLLRLKIKASVCYAIEVVLVSVASHARTQQGHASTSDQHHHLVVGENSFLLALSISTTQLQIVHLEDQECLQTNKWSSIHRVIGCKLPFTSIDVLNSP